MANNKQQNNSTDKNNLDQLFNKFNNKKATGQDDNAEVASNPVAKTTTAKTKTTNTDKAVDKVPKATTSKAKTNNQSSELKVETKAEPKAEPKTTANTNNNANANINTTPSVDKFKIELPKKELNKSDIQKDIELDLARAKNDAEKVAAKDKVAQTTDTKADDSKFQKAKEDLNRVARGTGSLVTKNNGISGNDNNDSGGNNHNGKDSATAINPTYGSKRSKLVAALAVLGLCLAGYSVYQVKTLDIDKKLEQYTATTVKAVQTNGTTANNNLQEIANLKAQIATLQSQLNQNNQVLTGHMAGLKDTGDSLSQVNQKVSDLEKSVLANNTILTTLGNQINQQAKDLTAEQQQLITATVNKIIQSEEYKNYLHTVIFSYLKANPEADPSSVANLSQSTVDQIVEVVKTKLKETFDQNTAALVSAQQASVNAQALATEAHNTAAQSKADASQAQYVADKALDQASQALDLSKQAQVSAANSQEQATQANNQVANALANSKSSLDLVQSTAKSTTDLLAKTTKELQDQAQQVSSDLKTGLENNLAKAQQAVDNAKAYVQSTLADQYLEEAQLLAKNSAPVYQVINKLSIAYDLAKSPELKNTILADINHFQDLPFSSADELNQAESELNNLATQAQDLPSLDATKFTSQVTKDASAFDKGLSSFINKFVTVNKSSNSDLLRENAGILINQQIQLKLSQAVIALQNNNSELYHSSLSSVEHLLTTYYPNNNQVVTDLLSAVKKFNGYNFTYKGYTLISAPVNK